MFGRFARDPRGCFALGGITVLLAALFWNGLARPRPALAQVPDSGLQRKEMIDELRQSNKKLAEIVTLLREIRDLQAAAKESPRHTGG